MWCIMVFFVGGLFGLSLMACLTVASEANEGVRRCENCQHSKPVSERIPDYLREGWLNCAACRGTDFDFPKEGASASMVKPEGFCDEFCERMER